MKAVSGRNLSNALADHFDEAKREIFTALPGKIVAYDAKTQTCTAQPILTNPQGEQYLPVYHVPVIFPSGGGAVMTFPVKAGDKCWISYSMFPIDEFVNSDGDQFIKENTFRSHDVSECVVYVGLCTMKRNYQPDPTKVMIRYGKTKFTMDDQGNVDITGKLTVSDTITGKDFISSTLNVSFNEHKHHYFWTDDSGDADTETPQ